MPSLVGAAKHPLYAGVTPNASPRPSFAVVQHWRERSDANGEVVPANRFVARSERKRVPVVPRHALDDPGRRAVSADDVPRRALPRVREPGARRRGTGKRRDRDRDADETTRHDGSPSSRCSIEGCTASAFPDTTAGNGGQVCHRPASESLFAKTLRRSATSQIPEEDGGDEIADLDGGARSGCHSRCWLWVDGSARGGHGYAGNPGHYSPAFLF